MKFIYDGDQMAAIFQRSMHKLSESGEAVKATGYLRDHLNYWSIGLCARKVIHCIVFCVVHLVHRNRRRCEFIPIENNCLVRKKLIFVTRYFSYNSFSYLFSTLSGKEKVPFWPCTMPTVFLPHY